MHILSLLPRLLSVATACSLVIGCAAEVSDGEGATGVVASEQRGGGHAGAGGGVSVPAYGRWTATLPPAACGYVDTAFHEVSACPSGAYCPLTKKAGIDSRGASGNVLYGLCAPLPEGCTTEDAAKCSAASGLVYRQLEIVDGACQCGIFVKCSGICAD